MIFIDFFYIVTCLNMQSLCFTISLTFCSFSFLYNQHESTTICFLIDRDDNEMLQLMTEFSVSFKYWHVSKNSVGVYFKMANELLKICNT